MLNFIIVSPSRYVDIQAVLRQRMSRAEFGLVDLANIVDLLPSAESFKKGCCQLQAKVCAQSTG